MSDSTEIKQHLGMINQRLEAHDRRFDDLSNEFHEFRILQEEQATKLDKVLDVVLHMNDRLAKHDSLVATVENHEHRISALEDAFRRSP